MGILGWGIVGTGSIASDFTRALKGSKTCRVRGVCGSSPAKAKGFAERHSIQVAAASLAELCARPEIGAVYVATPNSLHEEHALQAIEAGKHVLCEKPLTLELASAERLIDAARARGTFLMEAYMYRCHPLITALIAELRADSIGPVRHVRADFGFSAPRHPGHRLFRPSLGAGAILDVGGYPLSLARLIAGVAAGGELAEPVSVAGAGYIGPVGADEVAGALLRFESGVTAQLSCAVRHDLGTRVIIFGERGRLVLPNPWLPAGERLGRAATLVVQVEGQQPQAIEVRAHSASYALEAELVAKSLPAQEAPWPAMTWADTLGNMRALDAWRDALSSG